MNPLEAEAIATERLELLPLTAEHAEEMAAVLADPALHVFIGGAPESAQELRSRYQRWSAGSPDPAVTWCNWGIRLREEKCLVGTLQATISGTGPEAASEIAAEIAWVVGSAWQGRGIATEAAKGLVDWLGRNSVQTVLAHIHPDHHASAAVARAAGLTATDEWLDGEICWRKA